MAKKHEARKVEKSGGDVCLETNSGVLDPCQTYCGDVEVTGETYTPTNKDLTCNICTHTYEVLRHGIKIEKI